MVLILDLFLWRVLVGLLWHLWWDDQLFQLNFRQNVILLSGFHYFILIEIFLQFRIRVIPCVDLLVSALHLPLSCLLLRLFLRQLPFVAAAAIEYGAFAKFLLRAHVLLRGRLDTFHI